MPPPTPRCRSRDGFQVGECLGPSCAAGMSPRRLSRGRRHTGWSRGHGEPTASDVTARPVRPRASRRLPRRRPKSLSDVGLGPGADEILAELLSRALVLGLDGPRALNGAVCAAYAVARRESSRDRSPTRVPQHAPHSPTSNAHRRDARSLVRSVTPRSTTSARVVEGVPAGSLMQLADDSDAALIVVGRRGDGGVAESRVGQRAAHAHPSAARGRCCVVPDR